MNKSQYARHRGVSPKQVRRALALGWITLEPDGSIDPAKADRSWAAATDPAHPRGTAAAPPSTYINARLATQLGTTELRDFKLKAELATLVNAVAATAAVQSIADRARSSWNPWAARIAPEIADDLKVDVELVRNVLGRYVREHVASLSPTVIELR